ncbi:FKBP-type peptidyl-prolyl cis-trans isomerase [Bacteroidota bacterium]
MKTKYLVKTGFLIVVLGSLLQGCKKDNDQELIDQEMRQLQQYLKDNNITQEPTASGLYFIEIEEGTGKRPSQDYLIDIGYTTKLIDGTLLFTSHEDVAKANDQFETGKIYGPIRLQVGSSGVPGLDEGVKMMKEGGKAQMILPSSINGFYNASIGPSGPYSTHFYTVELIHAFDDPEIFQDSMINAYLTEHEIDSFHVTESGLYYIEDIPGEGDTIDYGNFVELWYTGTFLDGRVFDSNLDRGIMRLSIPAANYIPAWDEALRLMQEGTKAKIIVPYDLAYGPYGRPEGQIPYYKTLVFDIKIEKVE